jgi:nucleoid DNA-binding protein
VGSADANVEVVTVNEIVTALVGKYGARTPDVKCVINDFIEVVFNNIVAGTSVKIPNFGKFERRTRSARTCNHPRDKTRKIEVEAMYAVGFTPFVKLKNTLKCIKVPAPEEAQAQPAPEEPQSE